MAGDLAAGPDAGERIPALGGVYYRELALRVGAEAMQTRLSRLGHGNADISSGLDSFWLGGSLRFPREQVALLARLARGDGAVQPGARGDPAARIMVLDRARAGRFRAKTGLGELGLGPVRGRFGGRFEGWFVGLAERADRTFAFATYLHGRDMKTFGPHRIALTRRALALLGVLPEATG